MQPFQALVPVVFSLSLPPFWPAAAEGDPNYYNANYYYL